MARPVSVKTRVERGARFLDEVAPGWEDRIDLETLDLVSGYHCICGQLWAAKAKRSRSEYIDNGYDFAVHNLFAQANSWITSLVGQEPITRAQSMADGYALREGMRGYNVAAALGFATGKPIEDTWAVLEAEWKRLLRRRAKAKAGA